MATAAGGTDAAHVPPATAASFGRLVPLVAEAPQRVRLGLALLLAALVAAIVAVPK